MGANWVAVVPLGGTAEAVARRLAAEGAVVVLVADEEKAQEAGRLASEVGGAGRGRPAVFTASSEDDLDALVELLNELFRTGG